MSNNYLVIGGVIVLIIIIVVVVFFSTNKSENFGACSSSADCPKTLNAICGTSGKFVACLNGTCQCVGGRP